MVLFVDSLEKFASYSSYHRNPVNVIIHVVMVPLIVFSAILMGMTYPLDNIVARTYVPSFPSQYVLPHAAISVGVIILGVFSYLLEPLAGLILNIELVAMYYGALYVLKEYGVADAFWIGLAVHVISWISQFIGHGFYEGRRPALVSNITQTFVAPTFVIMEVLFLLGYRPQLKKQLDKEYVKHLPKTPSAKKAA